MRTCAICFIACLALALAPGARAASPDDDFLAAREAFRVGDAARFERAAKSLNDYVLEPYVAYWRLRMRIEQAAPEEVQALLERVKDGPVAASLRADWLRLLAARAGRLRQRLPDERHPGLASVALLRANPRADVLIGLYRRRQRGERRFNRLRHRRCHRRRARHVIGRCRPEPATRSHVETAPLHVHLEVVELAVGRGAGGVADQVVVAGVAHELSQSNGEVVPIDDRAAVGLLGQHPQRVGRPLQVDAILPGADVLVDPELVDREATRVECVD